MTAAPPPLRGLAPARVDRLVADLLAVAADLRVVAAYQRSRFLEGGIERLHTQVLVVTRSPLYSARSFTVPIVHQLNHGDEQIKVRAEPVVAVEGGLRRRIKDGDLAIWDLARSGVVLWRADRDAEEALRRSAEGIDPQQPGRGRLREARRLLEELSGDSYRSQGTISSVVIPLTDQQRRQQALKAVGAAAEAVMLAAGENEFNHWDSPFTYLIRGLRDAEVRDRVGELITEVLGEPELMGLLPGRQTALGAASLCRVAQALASEAARMLGDSEP
jgi:hypothetical protein